MASPRRVSARQNLKVNASQIIEITSSAETVPAKTTRKGKATAKQVVASTRDSGAALLSPIKNGLPTDRSSDIELVADGAASSSKATTMNAAASTSKNLPPNVPLPPPARSSSEELTDMEELEKLLIPKRKKQPAPRKRKSKGKEAAGPSEIAELEKGTEGDDEAKPKKRQKRSKKLQGPYLPVVEYPSRYLESKKFVGAHVSISEGAHYAPHRALRIGAKAFGLFVKSQRQWAGKPLTEDSIKLFPLRCTGKTEAIPDGDGKSETIPLGDGAGFDVLRHIVPHGSYLTNLCNNNEIARQKSYDNFLTELKMAEALGIGLFNIHPGSTLGAPREEAYAHLADCINRAHKETKFIIVLLENMAAGKNIVGGSFEDLAAVIALVNDKSRIGVCFDTCHGFAAGYDMRTEEAFNATWKQFDEIIGLKYLKAFHVNDSVKELGSRRDLHENIGAGELGLSAFHLLMRDPRFDNLPFILETPMISGSLSVDAKPFANGSTSAPPIASPSKVKIETKVEEEGMGEHDHSHGNDGDIEDNDGAQSNLTLGASTWKREIELLHELEKVPFGQTNDEVDRLSSEIMAIVLDTRRKAEERKQAEKAVKDAIKESKKAAQLAEKAEEGETAMPKKEKKPRAKAVRKPKEPKVEAKIESEVEEEMEVDSSEVDQLASDYEDPAEKL